MLGERSDQRGLWEADRLYLDHVGRESFYGLLASLRGWLFRDADFAEFYCPDNGRDSVPPSLLATALLLQSHDKVSDAEAKARADFDLRWKVALGIEAEDRPFAKSTLQVFRAQLILHGKVREVFESSLRLARESGCLKGRGMRVALDTTNILGRGAVKDTYNLLADGIVKLLRALAAVEQAPVREWAQAREYERYLGSSVKGEAAIDWADRQARTALLAKIVADADRLLELSRQAQGELAEDSAERQRIVAGAELLGQLLLQSLPPARAGVSKERMFESTFVIPHEKDPSPTKSASASQKVKKPTGRPEKTLRRRGATARNSTGSTVPNQAEENAVQQDGKGYEQFRRKNPDRAAYRRRYEQKRRQKAKEHGQCRDCKNPATHDHARCEVCAEQHRQYRAQARERAKQRREKDSGQTGIF